MRTRPADQKGTQRFTVPELQAIRDDALDSIKEGYAVMSASPITQEDVTALCLLAYCARSVAVLPNRRNAIIFPVRPPDYDPRRRQSVLVDDPIRNLADILGEVRDDGLVVDQALAIPDTPSPGALDNIPALQREMSELAGVLRDLRGRGLLPQLPAPGQPRTIMSELLHELSGLAITLGEVRGLLGADQPTPAAAGNQTALPLANLLQYPESDDELPPTDVDEPATPSPSPDPVDRLLDTHDGAVLAFTVGDGRHDLRLGAILYAQDYPDTPCLHPADTTPRTRGWRNWFSIDTRLTIEGRRVHVLARNIDWRIPIFGGRAVTGRALSALRYSCPHLWKKNLEARALILG